VEQDGERSGVSSQNDDLRHTAVEGLGGFVGALFELAVMRGLLDKVKDFLGEGCVGNGPGWVMSALFSVESGEE
jgi:hypothetical protein